AGASRLSRGLVLPAPRIYLLNYFPGILPYEIFPTARPVASSPFSRLFAERRRYPPFGLVMKMMTDRDGQRVAGVIRIDPALQFQHALQHFPNLLFVRIP